MLFVQAGPRASEGLLIIWTIDDQMLIHCFSKSSSAESSMPMPSTDAQQANAKPKSGLVWLASYPKSGNTWTRAFLSNLASIIEGEWEEIDVNSIGRFSFGENLTGFYKDRLGFEPTGSEEHRKQIAALRHAAQQDLVDRFEGLVFVKTHNALIFDRGHSLINFAVTAGAIYIVRNPLDVAISLAHHINSTIDQAIETMGSPDMESGVGERMIHDVWSSWSKHVMSWTRKPYRAIYVMRYEDMLNDPERTFGALARHLLLRPTAAQLSQAIDRSSFEKLRSQEEMVGFKEKPDHAERFFREGRAGQWRETLTPTQIDRIVRDHGEQMARFGYLPVAE
jgi:hypothetical protein